MTTEKCLTEELEKKPKWQKDVTTASIFTEECEKSWDKKHCWHQIHGGVVFIPGGTNRINEICCWCGETKSYDVDVTMSFSVDTRLHGPHYKEEYHLG